MPEHKYCPHCRRALADVGEVDQDHVVTESLGGVTTITSCKRCNSTLGGGVEARLVGPHGMLTMLSQAQGWTKGALWGEDETGTGSRSYFASGEHLQSAPRVEVVSQTEETVQLAVLWPSHLPARDRDRYLESLARSYGGSEADRRIGTAPRSTIHFDLMTKVDDLHRVSAKIALGTGAERWGDTFTLSPLADWLREVLDVWSEWPPPYRLPPRTEPHATGRGVLSQERTLILARQVERWMDAILDRSSRGLPVVGHLPLLAPITIMTPVDSGRATLIDVAVLGVVLPALGAPHPLVPQAQGPQVVLHQQRRHAGEGRDA